MKLLEFAVTGYKNLTREIRLTDLGRVNVIHGDNNVGKSNLLEALHLYFALLNDITDTESTAGTPIDATHLFAVSEHRIGEIFNVSAPSSAQIRMEAVFSIPREELQRFGIRVDVSTDAIRICLELRRDHGRPGLSLVFTKLDFSGEVVQSSSSSNAFVRDLTRYIARTQLLNDPAGRPSFALIEENRRLRGRPEPSSNSSSILSPAMLLALWDASTSSDPFQVGRFKLLKELVREHLPAFEKGELLVAFDRSRNEAFAMHEGPNNTRLRHHLLGSGVQQMLSLLGLLLTTDARMIAIEEPECNLRYTLQLRLRAALDALTRDERGPQQLFLSSHSPAFETEAFFYAMRTGDDGAPTIERREARDARKFVAFDTLSPPTDATAEVSWVSSEGLVLLPPHIRPRLEVESGGEVAFLTDQKSGRVEVLSEREYLDILGPEESDGANES